MRYILSLFNYYIPTLFIFYVVPSITVKPIKMEQNENNTVFGKLQLISLAIIGYCNSTPLLS